jgi:Spy/CpxP family protein refolding chaperone
MVRKLTLAAVAAASLGVMALAATPDSAGGFWPHHHHHHHWGHGHGFGFIGGGGGYDGCYVTRRVLTPFGFRWRTVNVCY